MLFRSRVIPFEIVQKTFLKNELASLTSKENRITDILSEHQELIDSLTEEEKEQAFNDNGDSFDIKKVKELIKELDDDSSDDESFKSKLLQYTDLVNEEKVLKKGIKTEIVNLHNKTKDTIESLKNDDAIKLLNNKWIQPLHDSIIKLSEEIISDITTKINLLKEKYHVTFSDISEEIQENQKTLISLIDELEIGRASCRERV